MSDEDLYNAIRKEATDSNYYGGTFIGKDTLLYKFVAQKAAEVGVPIENLRIRVIDDRSVSTAITQTVEKRGRSTDSAYILKLSSYEFDGHSNLTILGGTIKHELAHKKQGGIHFVFSQLAEAAGDSSYRHKLECEADFIAGKEIIPAISRLIASDTKYYHELSDSHPQLRKRLEASIIKSYIEEKSGIVLTAEDVKIEADCTFEITNKDKLKAITPELVTEARKQAVFVMKAADEVLEDLTKRRNGNDTKNTVPPTTNHIAPPSNGMGGR